MSLAGVAEKLDVIEYPRPGFVACCYIIDSQCLNRLISNFRASFMKINQTKDFWIGKSTELREV
jgi:hypothetical protein